MKGNIYKIVNLANDKVYIGQTIQPIKNRFSQHLYGDGCTKLDNAIRKYGKESFKIELIESFVTNDTKELFDWLDEREEHYIELYDSIKSGYNISSGGQIQHQVTEETKKKISEAQKGEKGNMWGKHHSEETKSKISKSVKDSITWRKPVDQFSLDGTYIQSFPSVRDAARNFSNSQSHIADVCNGKRKSCYGFIWKWKNTI